MVTNNASEYLKKAENSTLSSSSERWEFVYSVNVSVFCFIFCKSSAFILGVTGRRNPSKLYGIFDIVIQLWQMKGHVIEYSSCEDSFVPYLKFINWNRTPELTYQLRRAAFVSKLFFMVSIDFCDGLCDSIGSECNWSTASLECLASNNADQCDRTLFCSYVD